jgi:hypothetical protein
MVLFSIMRNLIIILLLVMVANGAEAKLSEQIKAAVIGPEAGEYGYEITLINNENGGVINGYPGNQSQPSILGVIQKIKEGYPNLKKISLSVGWYAFGDKAEDIKIAPKVRGNEGPDWEVAGYTRDTAESITKHDLDHYIWQGTPTDRSVVQLCTLLKNEGFEVTFYPFIFVDTLEQTWRGAISAQSDDGVANFLNEYNKFILHYAALEYQGVKLKDVLSGFIIGTELEALTKYRSATTKEFKFVDGLIELAAASRKILGEGVEISYAANWSEYAMDNNGWRHLDKLWADKNINYIGIDAYFPLLPAKEDQSLLTPEDIMRGWQSGINYDYYLDEGIEKKLSPEYALQNLAYWWGHKHKNPDGSLSAWVPKSKKIVFTEAGYTSINHTATEPWAYVDDQADGLGLPSGSNGVVDLRNQYVAYEGTLNFVNKINEVPENKGMIADIYWYNFDPKGPTDAWEHSHELKIKEYENSLETGNLIEPHNILAEPLL